MGIDLIPIYAGVPQLVDWNGLVSRRRKPASVRIRPPAPLTNIPGQHKWSGRATYNRVIASSSLLPGTKYGSVCLVARAADCKSVTLETPQVRLLPGPPKELALMVGYRGEYKQCNTVGDCYSCRVGSFMVDVVQLARTSRCGREGREFKSPHSPQIIERQYYYEY